MVSFTRRVRIAGGSFGVLHAATQLIGHVARRLIVTDIVSRAVSELSQLIVQISDTLRLRATLCGLRDNVRCSSWAHWKARSGLPINVN